MFNKTAYGLGSVRSYIREVFEYGRQQAKIVGEENVFDYSLGNPSIPAPEKVNETIINVLNTESSIKVHGYTSGPGDDTIREAVAKNLTERFGKVIRPANLFFTCGAAPALMTALTALACEDSEVIAIAPFFPEYKPFIESSGNKFVMVPADTTSFQIDMAALESLVNEHTQAIIVNSPNNPSGVVFSRETLEKVGSILGAAAEKYGHPIYIIADEPYRELVYDGVEVPFIPNVYKDTIVCYSWSKSLSLPGERIGYVLVPDDAADSAELFAAAMEEKNILDKLWERYELSHSEAQSQRMELESIPKATRRIGELNREIKSLGTPNIGAIEEFDRVNTRYTYLSEQRTDVEKAKEELTGVIDEITRQMTEIFAQQFRLLNESFQETFLELFGGGKARLELEDENDILGCGIEIKVQPPGKQLKTITLLSGGEKAFVAIALYFAIMKVHPTPFCVMDEIEAALDEANVVRYARYMRRIAGKTQFIVITHRRGTMEEADVLYGVTMQERGVSRILTINLNDMAKELKIK